MNYHELFIKTQLFPSPWPIIDQFWWTILDNFEQNIIFTADNFDATCFARRNKNPGNNPLWCSVFLYFHYKRCFRHEQKQKSSSCIKAARGFFAPGCGFEASLVNLATFGVIPICWTEWSSLVFIEASGEKTTSKILYRFSIIYIFFGPFCGFESLSLRFFSKSAKESH